MKDAYLYIIHNSPAPYPRNINVWAECIDAIQRGKKLRSVFTSEQMFYRTRRELVRAGLITADEQLTYPTTNTFPYYMPKSMCTKEIKKYHADFWVIVAEKLAKQGYVFGISADEAKKRVQKQYSTDFINARMKEVMNAVAFFSVYTGRLESFADTTGDRMELQEHLVHASISEPINE
jgi:hypothetical protein